MADTDREMAVCITGGCQCGAVRFELNGLPRNVSLCHCRMCQKASGGPFMAFGRVKVETLVWTQGAPTVFQSSSMVKRGFCSRCGTPLTYQRNERAISLTLGSFDDPSPFTPELRVGLEALLPWTEHIADLPSQMTDDWMPPDVRAAFTNNQHPDRDA